MSTIKNLTTALAISGALLGANEALANDSTKVAQKDTTLETIKINYPGDSKSWDAYQTEIKNWKVGNEIVKSDTSIKILPDSTGILFRDEPEQIAGAKEDLTEIPLEAYLDSIGATIDTSTTKVPLSIQALANSDSTSLALPDTTKPKIARNYLLATSPWLHDADGISLALDNFKVTITPSTNISVDEILDVNTGDKQFDVLEAKKATRNIIQYLHSSEAKERFGQSVKTKINNYQSKLKDLRNVNTLNDSLYLGSARVLTRALSNKSLEAIADSLFDKSGNCKVKDGVYAFMVRNDDKSESNPIYVTVRTSKDKVVLEGEQGITGDLHGKNLNTPTGNTYEATFNRLDNLEKAQKELKRKLEEAQRKEDAYLQGILADSTQSSNGLVKRLILGVHGGNVNGVDLGLQIGSVGILADYSISPRQEKDIHEKVTGPTSANAGLTPSYSTNDANFQAVGLSVQYNLPSENRWSAFFGAGANFWKYNEQKEVAIRDRKVENTASKSAIAGNLYAGPKFKISEKASLGAAIGYDTERGMYGKLQTSIRLGKK